jgi:hypothetical protein
MPDQPQNQSVVGEDGELIQADTTIDPNAYAEFVATYVHRDPLMFRIKENIREHPLISLFLITVNLCMAATLISDLFSNLERAGNDVVGIVGINLGIGIAARIVYMILQMDTRQ